MNTSKSSAILKNSHVVSMQTRGDGHKITHSVAICECGWCNEVAWGNYKEQDAAIRGHWNKVGFETEIS